ncbi:MAG: hypothetical protein ABUL48_01030 [Pseudorhodoplanes sp.]
MWALIVGRIVELALALVSAIKSVSAAILEWRAIEFGRAESDATHAEAAREADGRMAEIAAHPPARDEVIKRLEEGSA